MLAQWICYAVGQMHQYKITNKKLAEHMGVTPEYLSMLLNGHREPCGAEEKVRTALDSLIANKKGEGVTPDEV